MMGGFGGCCGSGWFGSLGGYGWAGIVMNLILAVAAVAGLGLLLVWLFRKLRMSASGISASSGGDAVVSPREVIAVRYARGELTRDDFMRMMTDLD